MCNVPPRPTMEPVVVVDGSNAIHANFGSQKVFRVARIQNVIGKLKKLGYSYKIGMKSGTHHYIMNKSTHDEISEADKEVLQSLVDNLEVTLLNAKKDDRWIHLAAIEFDGYILSHDQFRNEIQQWKEEGRSDIAEEILKRRVELGFFEDTPIFVLPPISEQDSAVSDPVMPEVTLEPSKPVVVDTPEAMEGDFEPLTPFPNSGERTELDPMDSVPMEDADEEVEVDMWGDPINREDEEVPCFNPEDDDEPERIDPKDGEETLIAALYRVLVEHDSTEPWSEIHLPLNLDMGRMFFAESIGVSDATAGVLAKISRNHMHLKTVDGGYRLHDLDSTNGTQFRGARVGSGGVLIPQNIPRLGRSHPEWPSILLGSRLLEIRIGATQGDVDHPCFDECACKLTTG
jgi:hypothetical protein